MHLYTSILIYLDIIINLYLTKTRFRKTVFKSVRIVYVSEKTA